MALLVEVVPAVLPVPEAGSSVPKLVAAKNATVTDESFIVARLQVEVPPLVPGEELPGAAGGSQPDRYKGATMRLSDRLPEMSWGR